MSVKTASAVLFCVTVLSAQTCDPSPVASSINGGIVMRSPRVHFVFWGSYWLSQDGSADSDLIVRSYGRVSPEYFSGISQYGAGMPMLSGVISTASYEPPYYVTFGDVGWLIQSLLDSRALPPAGGSVSEYYIVLLPPGALAPYRAFHDTLVLLNGVSVHAASITYGDLAIQDALHELIEGITDPTGNGVRVPSMDPPKGEIADACEHACSTYRVNGVTVPAYWSQADGSCIAPGSKLISRVAR